MDDEDIMGAGARIPKLRGVVPGADRRVTLTWEDNSVTNVDLSAHLDKFRVFAPLVDNAVFASVALDEWGWAIYWPGAPGAAVPSDLLNELPNEQGSSH